MAKCKICGARLEDGAAVCPSCGAKVAAAGAWGNAAASQTAPVGAAAPVRAASNSQPTAFVGAATPQPASPVQKGSCPSCGAVIIDEHHFCPRCGVNLKEAAEEQRLAAATKERHCPVCGSVLQQDARFCADCGPRLEGAASTPPAASAAPVNKAASSSDVAELVSGQKPPTMRRTMKRRRSITARLPSRGMPLLGKLRKLLRV